MKSFRRVAFTYSDALHQWEEIESKLDTARSALGNDLATLCMEAASFGLNPDEGPVVLLGKYLLEASRIDKNLLIGQRRLRAVFSFAGSSRHQAPSSLQNLLEAYLANVHRICMSFLPVRERLQRATEIIRRYHHLKDEPASFSPQLVLVSPETSEALFGLWERQVMVRKTNLDFLVKGLLFRAANSRRWYNLIGSPSAVPDGALRELEKLLTTGLFHVADDAALLKVLHLHQNMDEFVENLDREAEKRTAAKIKESCRHGWEKLFKRRVRLTTLRELKKSYRKPTRIKGADLGAISRRSPPRLKSIELLKRIFPGMESARDLND